MIKSQEEAHLIKLIVIMYPDEVRRESRRRQILKEDKLGQLGHCSVCGGNDGQFNIKRLNYFFCKKHKKFWCVGENIISDWRDETEHLWRKNKKKFAKYEEITGGEWIDKKIEDENLDIEKDLEREEFPF